MKCAKMLLEVVCEECYFAKHDECEVWLEIEVLRERIRVREAAIRCLEPKEDPHYQAGVTAAQNAIDAREADEIVQQQLEMT